MPNTAISLTTGDADAYSHLTTYLRLKQTVRMRRDRNRFSNPWVRKHCRPFWTDTTAVCLPTELLGLEKPTQFLGQK
ncbi:hypothetical protein CSKR_113800 [Clonorchis sinensis]|uniref:Uncharacterized protein n=1 Tax=Clonorchis sinensis TaxID=79923 RepID=A0A3R7D8Z7_CLOSI|nr:hypothetical protein CSKR_113800 [Clonorchis sinensis]